MKEGGRHSAVLEILTALSQGTQKKSIQPVDQIIATYFRTRRYIGSKDRQSIAEGVYGVLRHQSMLHAMGRAVLNRSTDHRIHVLIDLSWRQKWDPKRILATWDGGAYHPTPLDEQEKKLIQTDWDKLIQGKTWDPWIKNNYPEWCHPMFIRQFGEEADHVTHSLMQQAQVDLRVNILMITVDEVMEHFRREHWDIYRTPHSPWGIRLNQRRPVTSHPLFQGGKVEVQDEGSQLVSLLLDAKSGMQVCDFCAGAGGKTLAIASTMQNSGVLFACDISTPRLQRAKLRLRRAGVHNVRFQDLSDSSAKLWLKRQQDRFDRVLVDVPCSGSGTWRRNPDAKWRLGPQDIEELKIQQSKILDQASKLVKPGGLLMYATCSMWREENEDVVEEWLICHPDFSLEPMKDHWVAKKLPSCDGVEEYLKLNPYQHQTDGFFAAILRKNDGTSTSAIQSETL